MLDAFKKMGSGGTKSAKAQVDELQTLIATAREERSALSTMLTQVQLHSAKLAQAGKSLQQVDDKATAATTRISEVGDRLGKIDKRVQDLEAIDKRINTLLEGVSQGEQTAAKLMSPDGELQKHRAAVQQLSSQAIQTRASLEALKKEQEALDSLRDQLRQAIGEVKESAERTVTLKGDLEQMRGASGQLAQEHARLKDATREAREQANATSEAVKEVEKRLGPLAKLQEMSKTTEERMSSLNALAEHVSQKVKALESQKHTVEHAVVEANRLNEMVWSMEVQVQKLNEGSKQAARTEEMIERIEKLAREVGGQLDGALKAKEGFALDVARIEKDRTAMTEFVRKHEERLAIERKDFEAFDQRVRALQGSIAEAEKGMETLAARERNVATVSQRVDAIGKQMHELSGQADELQKKQASLDSLQEGLAQVDDLAKKTAWQFESLKASRQDLETLRKEIQEFYKSHAAATQLRDKLSADRSALETFLERLTTFSVGVPELQAKLEAITGKLALVDEGTQKAANLVAIADDLDRQMGRLASHQQFVERVEGRLNTLNTLTTEVDKKLDEQIDRRREAESLKSLCDGIGLQVTDAQQKLEAVNALQNKLLPLTAQHAMLKGQIDKLHERVQVVQREEAELAEQEKRLSEMLAGSRNLADVAAERQKQAQGLSDAVASSAKVKDELLEELSRVQGRQRDVSSQMTAAEEHLKRVEAAVKQLDQRRQQIAFADKKISAFESRLMDLKQMSDEVERKIQTLAARESVVEAVKREVESVHEISGRSKADLQHVDEQRAAVAALRTQVDVLLGNIGETETRLATIEARKTLVDEVQLKTNVIINMLEDVRINLETVGEQKAVVDHVMETFTRLTETAREASSTLRALQGERELAERIERSIKQLRARTGSGEEAKRTA